MLRCSFALITKNLLWGTTATWLECRFPFMILHVVLVWKMPKTNLITGHIAKVDTEGFFSYFCVECTFFPLALCWLPFPMLCTLSWLCQGNITWWSFLQIYLLSWVSRKVGCDRFKEWNSSCWFSKEVKFHLCERCLE